MLNNKKTLWAVRRTRASGFTLIELMVSLCVFLVISAAAFSLVTQHMSVFTAQQNQSVLNFSLRNAAAQMQIDMANAGSGFYPSADVSSWPIGVTIDSPTAAGSCYDAGTHTYGQGCFDELIVIKVDPTTPPAQLGKVQQNANDSGPSNYCTQGISMADKNSSELFMLPAGNDSLTTLASHYKEDDQFFVISKDGTTFATALLTKDAQVTGAGVKLSHNPTGDKGQNTADNDRYKISTTYNNKLNADFTCGDWVVKLSPAVYKVDASNPDNPKLARLQPGDPDCLPDASTPYKDKCIIAEQIIGFKVGALVRNPEDLNVDDDCKPYCYNPDSYGKDWSQIRALRITLIGRTTPNKGANRKIEFNDFDEGPYKIQAISVVVSPRSLTMRDER